jgi:hypothetical protein
MTFTVPFPTTITVVRPAVPDQFGDPTGTPTEHDIPGCVTWPAGASGTRGSVGGNEDLDHADTVTQGLVVLAPGGSDVLVTDRVRVGGPQLWEVDGAPAPYRSPHTNLELLELHLRKVTG